MAQPTEYNRQSNFSNYQTTNPDIPLQADSIDAEFNAIKVTLDEIRANLRLIQRDDGLLANGIVGNDAIAASLEIGFNPPTNWATATDYVSENNVLFDGKLYTCLASHTSGTFSTDLAAEYWEFQFDFGAERFAASYRYEFSTLTADADPGSGKMRFNHATITSVTGAYLDNLNSAGDSVTTWLDTFDDSNNAVSKGKLWIEKVSDQSVTAYFDVTGSVVDGTGYRKLTLSYINSSGAFTNGDELIVHFTPAGNDGSGDLTAENNLSDLDNAGTARTNLGLAIGSDVQAYSAKTAALAGLTWAANKLVYLTGTATVASIDFLSWARTFLSAANESAARTALGVAIGSDVQPYDADTAKTDVVQSFSKVQRSTPFALTDGTTISVDGEDSNFFTVTLGGNRTLQNPTNLVAGATYLFVITQDGTGSRTLAFGSGYLFESGEAPTLTTTAGAVDLIVATAQSTTELLCTFKGDFS